MILTIDHTTSMPLRDQIVISIRRAISRGDLSVGDPLPPAGELAEDLAVDRNTVLAAYRQMRDDGILEFRRGRPVRVARTVQPHPELREAARALIRIGARHGLDREDVIQLIREVP